MSLVAQFVSVPVWVLIGAAIVAISLYSLIGQLVAVFCALNNAKDRKHRAAMIQKAAHLQAQVGTKMCHEKTYGNVLIRVSEFVVAGLVDGLLTVCDDRATWIDGDIEAGIDAFYGFFFPENEIEERVEPAPKPLPAYVLDLGGDRGLLCDGKGDVLYFRNGDLARAAAQRYHGRFSLKPSTLYTYAWGEVSFVEDRL